MNTQTPQLPPGITLTPQEHQAWANANHTETWLRHLLLTRHYTPPQHFTLNLQDLGDDLNAMWVHKTKTHTHIWHPHTGTETHRNDE